MDNTIPAPVTAEVLAASAADNIAFLWGTVGVLVIAAAAVFAIALLMSPEQSKKRTSTAGFLAALAGALVFSLGLGLWWCFIVSALVLPCFLAVRALVRRTFPEVGRDA
ncbi:MULTISPECIES: hypothetical protein [unclassified Microbacterium]|uniref:hypothetical protein n=1 Tax=unclassified Microbacterium TaxID=2609290 RepID=UPI00109CEEFD|nr:MULTISPECIES: hypothetical protein [unclassified Microbacterium]